jgi:hypothetical protein
MKEFNKEDIKKRYQEINELAKQIKNLNQKLDDDYLGEDINELPNHEMDQRVGNYYQFIHSFDDINEIIDEIEENLNV